MKIEELAAEKITLGLRLEGLAMINIYGMSVKDRIELEIQIIESNKQLNEVHAEISKYEHSGL